MWGSMRGFARPFGIAPLVAVSGGHRLAWCMEEGVAAPATPISTDQQWPEWGPPKAATIPFGQRFVAEPGGQQCLVCAHAPCQCNHRMLKFVKEAYSGHAKLKGGLYHDLLADKELPWLRLVKHQEKDMSWWNIKCWLCSSFMRETELGKSKFGREGLPLGSMQAGQVTDHLGKAGAVNVHATALERYNRRVAEWKRKHWAEAATATLEPGTIESSMEVMRRKVEEERINHAHAVYLAVWLKESANECR